MVGLGLALGVLGAGLNTIQAIQSQKAMKQAAQAKSQAQQQLQKIKEFNAFKQVQVPTLGFELAQQSQAQATTQAVEATKGAGAEAVIGGVGNIVQAAGANALDLAAQANQAQFQRDAAQAEAEQGIQARQAERDFAIGAYNLQEAQTKEDAARSARNEAIKGAVGSLGSAALGAYEESPLYKSQAVNQGELSKMQWNPEQFSKFGKVNGQDLDFEALGNMNQQQYKDFWKSLTYNQQKMLQTGQ
jgi:type I site-specific restriction endonuclease